MKKILKAKNTKSKKDLDSLIPASAKVKRSKSGLGLFANEALKKGNFVIEYKGIPMTHKEAEFHPGKYLFEINGKVTIDGSSRKNIARYINHSCRPNCEPYVKQGRVLIFTKRSILKGEELTYDYGQEYFDEFLKPGGCKCEFCLTIGRNSR